MEMKMTMLGKNEERNSKIQSKALTYRDANVKGEHISQKLQSHHAKVKFFVIALKSQSVKVFAILNND